MASSPESRAEPSTAWNANPHELGPICEESHTRASSAFPQDLTEQFDDFDFVGEKNPPKRSPTFPFMPPGPSKEQLLKSLGKASSLYRNHPKRSYVLPVAKGKAHTEPILPGLNHIRHASTFDTNNSASFEDTAVWDQKAILSLGMNSLQTLGTLHFYKFGPKFFGFSMTLAPTA